MFDSPSIHRVRYQKFETPVISCERNIADGRRCQSHRKNGERFKSFKPFNRCALRLAARFKAEQFKSSTTGFRTKRGYNRSSDNRRIKIDRDKIRWSEAIAVGSRSFVEKVKSELGFKAAHRDVIEADGNDIAWSDSGMASRQGGKRFSKIFLI
jgi:hypothetical protein